jgi:hypothetical protein
MHLGDCGHGVFERTVAAPCFATMSKLLGPHRPPRVSGSDPAYLHVVQVLGPDDMGGHVPGATV